MTRAITFRNRQRVRRVDTVRFRRILKYLLAEHFKVVQFELCFHFVADPEMIQLNERYLRHQGTTDVITFDHRASLFPAPASTGDEMAAAFPGLFGEVYLCLDEALRQAQRYRVSWQAEFARYAIHGLLHLQGYDDRRVAARRKMKREENRLFRQVARGFPLCLLERQPRIS